MPKEIFLKNKLIINNPQNNHYEKVTSINSNRFRKFNC